MKIEDQIKEGWVYSFDINGKYLLAGYNFALNMAAKLKENGWSDDELLNSISLDFSDGTSMKLKDVIWEQKM